MTCDCRAPSHPDATVGPAPPGAAAPARPQQCFTQRCPWRRSAPTGTHARPGQPLPTPEPSPWGQPGREGAQPGRKGQGYSCPDFAERALGCTASCHPVLLSASLSAASRAAGSWAGGCRTPPERPPGSPSHSPGVLLGRHTGPFAFLDCDCSAVKWIPHSALPGTQRCSDPGEHSSHWPLRCRKVPLEASSQARARYAERERAGFLYVAQSHMDPGRKGESPLPASSLPLHQGCYLPPQLP